MKKLLFTILCLLAFAATFGQKWDQVGSGLAFPNGAPAKTIDIYKISAINPTTIFAYGSNTFLVSRDAGATWEDIAPGYDFYLRVLHFFDQDNGIAMGDSSYKGLILKTHDGGRTWYQMPIPNPPGNISGWWSASFKDSNDYVIGWDLHGTKDGGKTFKKINFAQGLTVGPLKEHGINYFGDSTICYYDETTPYAYYSENYGKTWTSTKFNFNGGDVNLHLGYFAPGNLLGFVAGFSGPSGHQLYMTVDGGKTWTRQNYFQSGVVGLKYDEFIYADYSFIDSSNGWLGQSGKTLMRFIRSGNTSSKWVLDTAGLSTKISNANNYFPKLAMVTPTFGYMMHKDSGIYKFFRYGSVPRAIVL